MSDFMDQADEAAYHYAEARAANPFPSIYKAFLAGVEWAISQEPTGDEVEASRLALHQALASDWMSIANVLGGDQREYDALLGDLARAALSTARAARRHEEKQHREEGWRR